MIRRREFITLLGGAATSSRSGFGLNVGNDYCEPDPALPAEAGWPRVDFHNRIDGNHAPAGSLYRPMLISVICMTSLSLLSRHHAKTS
jgi:hypothetical protein